MLCVVAVVFHLIGYQHDDAHADAHGEDKTENIDEGEGCMPHQVPDGRLPIVGYHLGALSVAHFTAAGNMMLNFGQNKNIGRAQCLKVDANGLD